MRALDSKAIDEIGIPGSVLMENAGRGAAELILEFSASLAENHAKRFVLLAGKGNNGGDAYVAARHLAENSNIPVILHSICPIEELKGDALHHARLLPEDVAFSNDPPEITLGDIVVDGLLGTGSTGTLRPPIDDWVARVNASETPVAALDMPTGLDGDDGTVADIAILADITITMGLPKKGMFLNRGPEICGALRVVDIGFPKELVDKCESEIDVVCARDARNFLRRRPSSSHKNSVGRVLVVGGSRDYAGAPVLAAEAALRSGAGLVTLAVPESAEIAPPSSRSIIFSRIRDTGFGVFSEESIGELNKLAAAADSILIGPGITTSECVRPVLEATLRHEKPMVLDADALNIVAATPYLLTKISNPNILLTPHPGEANRLLEAFALSLLDDACDPLARFAASADIAAATGCVTALKGRHTVTTTPRGDFLVNTSGTPALATAGTGDVLAGIAAAFIAGAANLLEPAAAAVFIHGYAGELSLRGVRGLTADDLLELIPEAMRRISPFA